MSKITAVGSSAQFSKVLSSNTVVIVDFWATWCGPCKAIAPVFEQLATSHSAPGKLAFAKVDTDANSDITQQYGVSAMPTFLIFKNGKVIDTIRGANASALRTAVSRAASGANAGAAASGAAFQNKGYRLGAEGSSASNSSGAAWTMPAGGLGGVADSMVRFFGLYLSTLFSFDAYAAAQASPFSVNNARRT